MHVILVANYAPDAQQSMLRFAAVLERELQRRGHAVTVLAPRPWLGRLRPGRHGLGKWLGYADKFLLFPWILGASVRRARRAGAPVVHVCDHSNAIYTRYLRRVPHVVTCNDLLAVRSARREFPQNPTRWSGRVLQRLIVAGLNRAQRIACISDATRRDVRRVCTTPDDAIERVYMGLNYPYRPLSRGEARPRVQRLLPDARRFILHVGGNQWYKNRPGVLEIYAALKTRQPADLPSLVMVGEPFTPSMRRFVDAHGLAADVVELHGVADADLEALYAAAELLLHPSLQEGFGWPVAEAMACGCPVVTSNRAPMTEVAADAAMLIDPDDPRAAAEALARMLAEGASERSARVERGFRRAAMFTTDAMIEQYLRVYQTALATAPNRA